MINIQFNNRLIVSMVAVLALSALPALAGDTSLIAVNHVSTPLVDSLKQLTSQPESKAKAASAQLGIDNGSDKGAYKFRHRNASNKNLILGGSEVFPM